MSRSLPYNCMMKSLGLQDGSSLVAETEQLEFGQEV